MADVLAIVSKAVFEADAPDAAPGLVLPMTRYHSKNPRLQALTEGGRLFLVTVRPPNEQLWLVAVLDQPKHDGKSWVGTPNAVPIRDVTGVITAKPGTLGMSLQTPRVLAADVAAKLLGRKTAAPARAEAPAKKAETAAKAERPAGDWGKLSDALKRGRFDDALGMLLDRWKDSRDPALAALIEKTAARTKPRGPFATLPTLNEGVRFAEALTRMTALARLPPDPRISGRLTRFLLEPPFTAQSSRQFWNSLFEQLGGPQADPRTVTALKPVVGTYAQIFGGTVMGAGVQKRIAALIAALEKQFPAPPDAGVPESLTQLLPDAPKAKAPAKGSEEALLAAIYADPKADAPREVYADFLQEKGDPRGEFIALQFRRARGQAPDEKREKALLKQHHAQWQGPLRDITYNDQDVFERGFLAECRLRLLGGKIRTALGHPGWATVRKIHLAVGGTKEHGVSLLVHPAMRHLEELVDAPYDVVRALGEQATDHALKVLAIEWMELTQGGAFADADWAPLLSGKTLKRLEVIRLGCEEVEQGTLASFWASPRAATLKRLELSPVYSLSPKLLDDVRAKAPKGLTVVFERGGYALSLGRSGPGTLTALPPDDRQRGDHDGIEGMAKFLPKGFPVKADGIPDALLKQLR